MSLAPVPDVATGDIERFLQEMIANLAPASPTPPGRGRPRVLPSLCLWAGLLVCVLRGFSSQLALWRLLTTNGLWDYPRLALSDQAIYKRLAGEGVAPLQQLLSQLWQVLRERLAPWTAQDLAPFAQEVLALDETRLDKMARTLPSLREIPNGDPRLLPGRLAGLFDLRRQLWQRVEYAADAQQNEKVLARQLVQDLPAGSLLLADLGYFGFAWFDWLTDQHYYWVSRLRAKTSYIVHHVFYQQGDLFDGLVWLGAYRADRAAHAVRLVQFRVGTTTYRYLTNVLDPVCLPIAMIARLYARRWDIELAFKLVKRHLGLHLLWSAKTVVIQQQIWAVLIISQVLQALRMEIAGRAHVDPYEVSMALLVEYLPQLAQSGQDPVQVFVGRGRQARLIRPSTRTIIQAPEIPEELIQPLPHHLPLWREPRYANRRCHRHDQTQY